MASAPPTEKALFLDTQLELVSGTTTGGTLYGIAFSIYCQYIHASLPQLKDHERRKQAQFMITSSTIIMICGLYYLISNAWVIQDAYIQHSNFPGGPLVYEDLSFHKQPVIAVGLACQLVVDILTSATQIWRVWVVWSGTRYANLVIVLPLLCLLAYTAITIRLIIISVVQTGTLLGSQESNLQTGGLALQGITMILPTLLIAGLLTFESRRQSHLIGQSHLSTPYMNVVAMLVESYVLEAIWTILGVILFAINNPVLQFFGDTQVYIEIIAYLLVLYRVAYGRAYRSQRPHVPQSRRENEMSSLRWNPPAATPQDALSEADVNIHPRMKPETDILQGRYSPA